MGDPKFIAITNDFFETEGKHSITFWFKCTYKSEKEKASDISEMDSVGWFSKNELPVPLFLPLKNLLYGKSYPNQQVVI